VNGGIEMMPLTLRVDLVIMISWPPASAARSIAFGSIIGDDWAMRADLPRLPFPNHGA
jgi:hypothetical protein